MKFILGKKLEMTQVWRGEEVVSVTRVQAGPCKVVQIKNDKKDGYDALQIGFGEKKEKNIKKPQIGHLAKVKTKDDEQKVNLRYLREFRPTSDPSQEGIKIKAGDIIDVSTFEIGDNIQVTGVSKGKGFQGVVKRHGFHGHSTTHGTKDQVRMPGSAGATGPAHVFKGQRMPGRMGGDKVTTKNLEIIEVDLENNILLIKGAVPGARNGLILVSGEGELKLKVKSSEEKKEEPKTEEAPEEKKEENIEKQEKVVEEKKEDPSTSSGQEAEKKENIEDKLKEEKKQEETK